MSRYIENLAETFSNKNIKQSANASEKPLDICTPVVTWGICPICKGELNKLGNSPNRVFKGSAYCMDCGQKLDWSEINGKNQQL